jgi:three-Cys-motif partner protein
LQILVSSQASPLPNVSSGLTLRAMPEQEVVWEIDRHTLAKHEILKTYLQAWLPIMSRWNERLVIVDGFAGPGVYKGGEPGSPIIALKAFFEHEHKDRITADLVYVFIEENGERVARLSEEIAKLDLPQQVKHIVIRGTYEDEFAAMLDALQDKGASLAPTFAFIDPFGYSDAPLQLSERFLQFERCEVLLYAPLFWINRFLSRAGQEKALTSFFGTDRWKEAIPLPGAARIRFLHDLLYEQLKTAAGLQYVRSFEILASANRGYHLFFGTNDKKQGLPKMKGAMWKIDPVHGRQYRDTAAPGVEPLFELEPDLGPLREALRDHFGTRVFSIEEALDFTVVETDYLLEHVKRRTLKPLELDGKLEVVEAKPNRRRGDYPDGTRVRFTS